MKIEYDGQLLTTTISLCYRKRTMQLSDIVIDTGSSHTIFSPDALKAIGVTYENGDPVYEAYGIGGTVPFYTKMMDFIQLDTQTLSLQISSQAASTKRDCFCSRKNKENRTTRNPLDV